MSSLLMPSPPISISHRLFRCRYSNSRDVIASSPSFCQSALESLLAGYFLRTPSIPITTGVVSISIFHLLALSVNIIRPPSLFLGRIDDDRWELQFWIPSSLDVNTLFFYCLRNWPCILFSLHDFTSSSTAPFYITLVLQELLNLPLLWCDPLQVFFWVFSAMSQQQSRSLET